MEVRRPGLERTREMISGLEEDQSGPALGASRVGAELRAARLRVGWSLPDLAQHLRIRLPFLEALEGGRIAELPGPAYALGFVRTYAAALGLDPDEVARRFRAEAQEVNRKTELTFPAPVPERGVPAGAVVLLGLMLAIGAYGGWYKYSETRRADTDLPPVPDRLAAFAAGEPSAGTNVSPQVASILPTPTSQAEPASTAPQASGPISPVPSDPTAALAAPMPRPVVQVPVPVPVPVTVVAPVPPAQPGPEPETSHVVLRFKADSRVQVRQKQGPVLLNRVMRAGESWAAPNEKGLLMTTDNAGGTEIVVNGVTAASLGPNGKSRRDLSLEPDMIRMVPATKLPAQPRPQ